MTEEEQIIRSGFGVTFPHYPALPSLDLVFGKNHLPSLEYGADYFLCLSKVNDLNRISTETLSLYTHGLMAAEDDLERAYASLGVKTVKTHGKTIHADAVVLDMSAYRKLYKTERAAIKSNNELNFNNLFCSNYDMLTFKVFRPLFFIGTEKYCVVKLPTLFGRTVANAVRVYCSVFKCVRLFKSPHDSWFKDSALMICSGLDAGNLARLLTYLKKATRSNAWKDENDFKNYVLVRPSVEPQFLQVYVGFANPVYRAIFLVHTYLYESINSEAKSVQNEHQEKLLKILYK
ncbi:mRNA capping enzyme small subunit [Nile crocodilepox virus]|uniref:mRNA capping enzyme small subunit n=1 Tax=Nile crocodilepox virus (isolate Crocodylus niloticus/Zimbabwe/Ume/2001) TaxID=1289473 RepID=Q070D2_CPRVZ|nr:mRNA capping enzyme small subunit [Nile crocodilepox virus]ABJ09010.1 mRNA capping enzyme small subunit [Nile crocodilepox virus]